MLSSLLQASTASWFTALVSAQLSRIPLRQDGVFQTILFLASQFAPSLGREVEQTTRGPPITVQAIMQSSRLLSSIPQGMSPEDYFHNIGPKLLALLDGSDPDLKKTASYVIGNGILGKRSYGAPGAIGFTIFVQAILDSLNGKYTEPVARWLQPFGLDGLIQPEKKHESLGGTIIIPELKLRLALNRLVALVLLHPNPGLIKRLINPVLLPLWGLQCYGREHQKKWWEETVTGLLQTFFSVTADATRLLRVAANILWDGPTRWTYGPGEEGGISIRQREGNGTGEVTILTVIERLDERVDSYMKMLAADPQKDDFAGDIFLKVSREWLVGHSDESLVESESDKGRGILQPELQKLVSAKIAEKLLEQFKDSLSRHPIKLLELIQQLIEGEKRRVREGSHIDIEGREHISLNSLGNIVNPGAGLGQVRDAQVISDMSDSLSPAFSLLSTILTSPEFHVSESISPLLVSMKSEIDSLIPNLPSTLVHPATTSSMLLEITLSDAQACELSSSTTPSRVSDYEMHRQAINNLSSPLPPVQAEGISILSKLIEGSSPVLDIPATLTLLLSVLASDDGSGNDEFLYLNLIKLIGALASKHPRTVIKTLTERYADRSEESTLDRRLKVGEALLRTVQGLGGVLVGEAAKILGDTMIEVASRRGSKPKAREERKKMARRNENESNEPNEPNEGPIESIPDTIDQMIEDTDSEAEDPAKETYSRNILEAWAAGAPKDSAPDDLRVRASAISILASAISTNTAGLGPTILSSSVDLAISILTLETGEGNAILRRAAAVLLLDLIKAFDEARNSGKELGFGFSFVSPSSYSMHPSIHQPPAQQTVIGNVPDILRVIGFVESKETDAIVRGHLRVLAESLEAWLEKSLLWGICSQSDSIRGQPNFGLGDRLEGLDLDPLPNSNRGAHPRIEEIE